MFGKMDKPIGILLLIVSFVIGLIFSQSIPFALLIIILAWSGGYFIGISEK